MLGLTGLLVALVNDSLDNEMPEETPPFEPYGLGLLAVSTLLVVVLAAMFGRQPWLGHALVPLTSGVAIVAFLVGVARFD
jgi:hypothetical protein